MNDNSNSLDKIQKEVRDYVLNRPLYRPKINVKKTIVNIIIFLSIVFIVADLPTIIVNYTVGLSAISNIMPIWLFILLINIIAVLIGLCIMARKVSIFLIRFYQRFARESTRRRCLCKPTCSEYAIEALEKYNFFKAIKLIFIRLTRTCVGDDYKIDELK